jgi:hypothetical protein
LVYWQVTFSYENRNVKHGKEINSFQHQVQQELSKKNSIEGYKEIKYIQSTTFNGGKVQSICLINLIVSRDGWRIIIAVSLNASH